MRSTRWSKYATLGSNAIAAHASAYAVYGGPNKRGDPHNNAGIIDKAAWLLGRDVGTGAASFAGIAVTPIGHHDTGALWYHLLVNDLGSSATFRDFRYHAINSAYNELFGSSDPRSLQTKGAVNAVGIWSYSSSMNSGSNDPIAIADMTISGAWKKHLIYTEPVPGTRYGKVYHRSRSCSMLGTCSWSTPAMVDYGAGGVSAVVFNGSLWAFYKYDISNSIRCKKLSSSGVWQTCGTFGNYTSDRVPSAAVLGDEIVLFFKEVGAGVRYLKYAFYSGPSGLWSVTQGMGSYRSPEGPWVGGVIDGKLYGAYIFRQTDYDDVVDAFTMDSGHNLDSPWPLTPTCIQVSDHGDPGAGYGHLSSVSAAVFRNRFHVAARHEDHQVAYASYCPSGAGCTYRPEQWSGRSVYTPVYLDDAAYGFITLKADSDGLLYCYEGAWESTPADPVYFLYKSSE